METNAPYESTITIDTTSIESVARAIYFDITTPELMAAWIDGSEMVAGVLVLHPSTWHAADDGNSEVELKADGGVDAAQEYVDSGDWGKIEETTWITVCVWREGIDAHGNIVHVEEEHHTITIQPEEPKCTDGEHDWQSPYEILGGCKENPGVCGNGGGVLITEVCMRCGCARITDTWAQNPTNGEQGLRSVKYEAGKYADEIHGLP